MGPVALLIAAACTSPGGPASLPAAGPPLRGDVDGDGRQEAIAVRYRPTAPASCGFLLTARGASGVHTLRLRMTAGKYGTAADWVRYGDAPIVRALAAIDRRAGIEVLVELWRGASSHGGSVFTFLDGRLRRMSIEGRWDDEFTWWGSVTHNGNVDCIGGPGTGRIATRSGGVDVDGRHLVESRSAYVVRGTRFQHVRTRSRSGLRGGQRWWTDVPDVGMGPPFRRCAVAVAPGF
jgi:hypothetical protein